MFVCYYFVTFLFDTNNQLKYDCFFYHAFFYFYLFQPTSNLVAPDSLKRQHQSSVRFSEEIEDHLGINNATATVTENKSPSLMNDFYQKENKTLNVNVLAEDSEEMNNEISFDSEKFSKTEAKSRPRGTIDNLTENICNDGMINSGKTSNNTKRIKNIEIPIEKSPDNR